MRLTEEQIDRVVAATAESRGEVRFDRDGRPTLSCVRCRYPRIFVDRPYWSEGSGRAPLCQFCVERILEPLGVHRVRGGRRA